MEDFVFHVVGHQTLRFLVFKCQTQCVDHGALEGRGLAECNEWMGQELGEVGDGDSRCVALPLENCSRTKAVEERLVEEVLFLAEAIIHQGVIDAGISRNFPESSGFVALLSKAFPSCSNDFFAGV